MELFLVFMLVVLQDYDLGRCTVIVQGETMTFFVSVPSFPLATKR